MLNRLGKETYKILTSEDEAGRSSGGGIGVGLGSALMHFNKAIQHWKSNMQERKAGLMEKFPPPTFKKWKEDWEGPDPNPNNNPNPLNPLNPDPVEGQEDGTGQRQQQEREGGRKDEPSEAPLWL